MIKTVRDYLNATKEIKQNPLSHGYSKDDCAKVAEFENTMIDYNTKIADSLETINRQLVDAFKFINDSTSIIEERFKNTKSFVNNDWFISFNFMREFSLQETLTLISNQDKDVLEKFILERFPSEATRIFKSIRDTIPHRALIVNEIEELFTQKHYHSVVVLCYTQVDGICNENLRYGFFDNDSKTKTYELKIKQLEPNKRLGSNIALQLKEPKNEINRYVGMEVSNSTHKIDSFNRHLVMHGHSYNFGTQLNAIRAVLLLDFVCSLIMEEVIIKNY